MKKWLIIVNIFFFSFVVTASLNFPDENGVTVMQKILGADVQGDGAGAIGGSIEPNQTSFIIIEKSDPRDTIKVKIGNDNSDNFIPSVELSRWDEVSFKITPDISNVPFEDRIINITDEKIKFDTPDRSFELYSYKEGEGGYKFIWYLNNKPKTNRVTFNFESTGLDFYYQDALDNEFHNGYSEEFQQNITVTRNEIIGEKGQVLFYRPENVIGSYAVYSSTKGGYVDSTGKDYKTGKAFHIFPPNITDSIGQKTKGILTIDKYSGTYTIEIPQDFLDKAVYPIKGNDEFGYHDEGQSTSGIFDNYIIGSLGTLPEEGTFNFISFYVSANAGGDTMKCAIYTSAGAYTNEETEERSDLFTNGIWEEFDYADPPTYGADDYLIVTYEDGSGITLGADTGSSGNVYDSSGQTYPTWPSTGLSHTSTVIKSIYVDYDPTATTTTTIPADTCTYGGSGDWGIDCADGCNITSDVVMDGSDLLIRGSGYANFYANVTGCGIMFTDCQVYILDNNKVC